MKFILNINKYIVIGVSCIFFLYGCMGGMASWNGHIVKKNNWIPLEETASKTNRVWNTDDLSLKYDYLKRGDRIQLDGEATLADKLKHFGTLDNLSIMVQFIDGEGMVLGSEILYVSSHRTPISMAWMSFSRSFVLPSKTSSISFSYSGKVSDGRGDDGIAWDFWSNP